MSDEKNIQLIELAERYPNLTISVKCSDLLEAFRSIIEENKLQSDKIAKEESVETLLNEEEVKKTLEVSHSTLYRWHKAEYLVPVKIGRKVRYKKSEIEEIRNKQIKNFKKTNYD